MIPDTKFSLFPIERIARNWIGVSGDNFDDSILPFEIVDSVHFEDVSKRFRDDEFHYCRTELGTETTKYLEKVKYAIVHRYPSIVQNPEGGFIFEPELSDRSRTLIQEVMACLRLIRPIVHHAQFMGGSIADDGTFSHFHFDNPNTFVSPLANQKMFSIRTEDIEALRVYAAPFVAAMEGKYWKFRMAVDMFQSGYFQHSHWKLRFFMWTAALEALFTSHTNSDQRGASLRRSGSRSCWDHLSSSTRKGNSLSLIRTPS
jgi:hypothetical protein